MHKTKTLSRYIERIITPYCRKSGIPIAIFTSWDKIVGEYLGAKSMPHKMIYSKDSNMENYATLSIYTADSSAAAEINYMQNIIINRLASYFGYKAITKIRIVQKL